MIIGKNIGDYRILAKTRLGESGTIYKAVHIKQRQTYALKILKGSLLETSTQHPFLEKLKLAQQLDHPNIARLFPVEFNGEYTIIPMEFVYGQNISEKISGGRSLFDFVLRIALQATGALIMAHETGIVHERITSNNLMVSADGHLKMLDFALRHIPEGIEAPEPENDVYTAYLQESLKPPLSKFAYLAPEQVQGKGADERSDLFALGVILYELSVGEFLFEGENIGDLYRQILERDLPKLRQARSDASPSWSKLLHALLQKDPAERYPSARKLMNDLQRINMGHRLDQPGFRSKNQPITRRSFFRRFIGERGE